MKLYDEIITEWNSQILKAGAKMLPLVSVEDWPMEEEHGMIFASDMAYELGGDNLYAKGISVVTEEESLVPQDEVYVVGPDLPEITENMSYARIALVRVGTNKLGEGDALYSAVQRIEFTKYHVNPKGFMFRVSAMNDRESARVSKEAVKKGISFSHVAAHYGKVLHENPKVEAVKQIFITDPAFPFQELDESIRQARRITKTIDHIFKDTSIMDCKACNLQEVCEEVEGLRELHFAQSGAK